MSLAKYKTILYVMNKIGFKYYQESTYNLTYIILYSIGIFGGPIYSLIFKYIYVEVASIAQRSEGPIGVIEEWVQAHVIMVLGSPNNSAIINCTCNIKVASRPSWTPVGIWT